MPIFFSKMFIFDHFWPFLVIFDHFLKKFQNRHFYQKCFLVCSKSIPNKTKNFNTFFKVFSFGLFLTVLDHFEFFGSKMKKKITKFKEIFFDFFELSSRSLRLKMRLGQKFIVFPLKLDLPTPVYVRDDQKWKIG